MSGYGLNQQSNGNAPPPGYQGGAVLDGTNTSSKSGQIKKQLTLSEKQELASRLEKDLESSPNITSSMSMSGIKSNKNKPSGGTNTADLLTDSLMDRNLAGLNISAGASKSQIQQPALFAANTQSTTFPNSFSNPIAPGGFNQFRPTNNSMMSTQPMTNQQMGFFGNLALPAPSPTTSSNSTMNSLNSMSLNTMKPMTSQVSPGSVMTPSLIPPPPSHPAAKSSPQNTLSQGAAKKTALDDLHDIFG